MSHLRSYLTRQVFVFLVLVLPILFMPSPAQAQLTKEWTGVCVQVREVNLNKADAQGNVGPGTQQVSVPTIQGFQCLVANVLSVFLTVIGLAGFAILIVSGFRYMVSGGNSKGVENARNSITFAISGLVLAISAFFILNLIAQFTGVNTILNFAVPSSLVTPGF